MEYFGSSERPIAFKSSGTAYAKCDQGKLSLFASTVVIFIRIKTFSNLYQFLYLLFFSSTEETCTGITYEPDTEMWTLRKGVGDNAIRERSGYVSYLKQCSTRCKSNSSVYLLNNLFAF